MTTKGYPSSTSVYPGEKLDFYLSSDPPIQEPVTLEIEYVCGTSFESFSYYLKLEEGIPFQPEPPKESSPWATGFNWEKVCSFIIPSDGQSGFYQVKHGDEKVINFVVKQIHPGSVSKIVFQYAMNTAQAYNTAGGKCVYESVRDRAYKVSFNRPGALIDPPDLAISQKPDLFFMQWLRSNKIAVEFCNSIDLHLNSVDFANYNLMLIVGHDEYWSQEMLDNLESFIYNGGNVAVFSGNTCYRQVRFEDNMQVMVCYKSSHIDPLTNIDNSRVTVAWSHTPLNRPPNRVFGIGTDRGWWDLGPEGAHYTIRQPYHWVFHKGDGSYFDGTLLDCVGYETDAAASIDVGGIPFATGTDGTPMNFTILATADNRDLWKFSTAEQKGIGKPGQSMMGIYHRNGTVFNVGSIDWGYAMYHSESKEALGQITRNVINKLKQRNSWHEWEVIEQKHSFDAVAMTAVEKKLYAVTEDNRLIMRYPGGINSSPNSADNYWQDLGAANNPFRLAATDGKLFLASKQGDNISFSWRFPYPLEIPWQPIEQSATRPKNMQAFAGTAGMLYALDEDGTLWAAAARTEKINWFVPIMFLFDLNQEGAKVTSRTVTHITGVNDMLFAITNSDLAPHEIKFKTPFI